MGERFFSLHLPKPSILSRTHEITSDSQRLLVRPEAGDRCDRQFVDQYRDTGGSRKGARRHFEVLQKLPVGYEFAGTIPDAVEHIIPRLKGDPSLIVGVRGDVYSRDGELLRGHVALARLNLMPNPNGSRK